MSSGFNVVKFEEHIVNEIPERVSITIRPQRRGKLFPELLQFVPVGSPKRLKNSVIHESNYRKNVNNVN